MCQKDADGKTNSVGHDQEQSDLGLHCSGLSVSILRIVIVQ